MAREAEPVGLRSSDADRGRTILKANRAYTREEMRDLSRTASPPRARARQMDAITEDTEPSEEQAQERREIRTHREPSEDRQPRRQREEAPPEPEEPAGRDEPDDEFDDTDEAEDGPIETLGELLEDLGIDPDVFNALKVERKVNGETEQVTYADLLAGSQTAKANTQKAQKLAAQERKFEAQQNEQLQELRRVFAEARQRAQAAYQVLQADLQNPQIAAMRESDPAGYLQWQEQTNRRAHELEVHYQQISQQEQQMFEAAKLERMRSGLNRLREVVPDIDTDERKTKIIGVFQKFGGDENLVANVQDERVLWLASAFADAQAELEELKQQRDKNAEKARQIASKSKRRGPRKGQQSKQGLSKKQVAAARERIASQKSRYGRTNALAGAILDTLQQGRR